MSSSQERKAVQLYSQEKGKVNWTRILFTNQLEKKKKSNGLRSPWALSWVDHQLFQPIKSDLAIPSKNGP